MQDEDAVGEAHDLVQVGRHEQHGETGIARGDHLLVDELDGADVDPAGRLRRDQHPWAPLDLAGDDQLLGVAAGVGARQHRRRPGAHVVLLDDPLRVRLDRLEVEQAEAPGERRAVVVAEHRVPGGRVIAHQAALVAVFGHVRHAGLAAAARAVRGDVATVEAHDAGVGRPQAGEHLHELGLAVAFDPGDADHLAGAHGEVDAVEDRLVLHRVAQAQARSLEAHLARLRRPLVDAQQHLAADHHVGEPPGVGRGALDGADHGPVAHDAHPVADLHHLVELVGDEDHRVPLGGVRAQELEEAARLLRRQHRGRFVHHQDPRVAVQRLEDLDLLLKPDGELVDPRVGIEVEAEARDQVARPLARPADVEQRAPMRLRAQDQVLGDGQRLDQHEVLVHHPDPRVDRVAGAAHGHGAAVDLDLAGVRRLQAVEDLHERALAGAVLADEGVHLAPRELEVDVVVREDQGEALDDVDHAHGRGHAAC